MIEAQPRPSAGDPNRVPCPAARGDNFPAWLFTRAVWVVLAVGLMAYVFRYGPNVPWQDDWALVPFYTGDRALSAAWLWEQWNEHRLPVTKLILYGLSQVTHGDSRGPMVLSALLLCGLALAMIMVTERVRGSASYFDACFPLLLLHWGHQQNLLHQVQLYFVTAVALFVAFTLIVVRDRWQGRPASVVALGMALVLLPLHGAMGLVYLGPLVVWSVYAAVSRWKSGLREGRRDGALLLAFTIAAATLAALYFVGYHPNPNHPRSPSLHASLVTAAKALAVALGTFGIRAWPASAVGVVGLATASGLLLLAALRYPANRLRAAGLLLGMVAVACLAFVVGVGRAGLGPDFGFSSRYSVLTTPILFLAYYAWTIYGHTARQLVQAGFFALACVALASNVEAGYHFGGARQEQAEALRRDIRLGLTSETLASCHYRLFYPWSLEVMRSGLEMLRQAGMGPYEGILSTARTSVADSVGVYRPTARQFHLRHCNVSGPADVIIPFGEPGDVGLAGDWVGSGTTTIGVFRAAEGPTHNTFLLRNSNSPGPPERTIVGFGQAGDLPIVGDWDGNGTTTIGLFRPAAGPHPNMFLLRNTNSPGSPDVMIVGFGQAGDLPIVGDWDGNGTTTIGLFRPAAGPHPNMFLLRNTNSSGPPDISISGFGAPGDLPVVGDWNGDRRTKIGLYRPSTGQFFLRFENGLGAPNVIVDLGFSGDEPLAGHWIPPGRYSSTK
jgi:hypothetical protein